MIPYAQRGIPEAARNHISLGSATLWAPARTLAQVIRRSRGHAIASQKVAIKALDTTDDVADVEAYEAAADALEAVMDYTLDCRVLNYFRAVFTWPIRISPRYIELVMRHDTLALAIYAHWLVLTMLLEDLWWIQDFGTERITKMAASWDPDSPDMNLLRWPLEMLEEWRGIRA